MVTVHAQSAIEAEDSALEMASADFLWKATLCLVTQLHTVPQKHNLDLPLGGGK